MNTLNPFQALHLAASAPVNRHAKTTPACLLTLKNPQYLCFPPLKKINVWQLSYVFAVFLISFWFWRCQHILQYAAVPLITFWNSLTRNASAQRTELPCTFYTVYSYEFWAFPSILLLMFLFRWVILTCEMFRFCGVSLFCFSLTYFG